MEGDQDSTKIYRPKTKLVPKSVINANKAVRGSNNYSDAIDMDMSKFEEIIRNFLRYGKDNINENIPAGISNCTLTATGWIDPDKPIARAKTIVAEPERYGFILTDEYNIKPGGLIISKVPGKDSYHTMLYVGDAESDYIDSRWGTKVKKGDKKVSYSSGGNEPKNLRKNVPLKGYILNSDGHTELLFFNVK